MKKRGNKKAKVVKESKFVKNFLAFGDRKNVFKGITITTIFLSIVALPMIVTNSKILNYFILVWLLELVYVAFYMKSKKK